MTAVAPASTGRLLRIEIKHSAVPWVLPLLAALFLYDPFRTASGYPAVWDVRASVVPNKMLLDFIPFTAAFAAWAGSREGRRRTADLLASTAHSAWSRQAAAFAATAALFVLLSPATAAIAIAAAGVALAGTAFGLTATATHGVSGWDIPALHDAASDRPISYTPVCAGTGLRVCMHPAFSYYLDDTAADLAPVAAEIAGLPGAPVHGEEVNGAALASTGGNGVITGNQPVYQFSMNTMLDLSGFQETNFRETFQQDLLDAFVAPGGARNADVNGPSYTSAQQAVVIALMQAVGSRPTSNTPFAYNSPINAQVAMAADRFAALSPAARHAWLATHLTALQFGHITLEQLP
jgi:hypothetical protein